MPERNYAIIRFLQLASLLLASCSLHTPSSLVKNQMVPKWRAHQQSVSALSHYQTRGAFAYFSNQKTVYARFNWQQFNPERYRLILTNPFGITEMDLNVQPGMSKLVNNQGKCYVSNDPEVMIQKLAGMSIPFHDLKQWILGLPGSATVFKLDSRGYLHSLNYSYKGQYWAVKYTGYYYHAFPVLPSHLELRQGKNRIKMKMDSWSL